MVSRDMVGPDRTYRKFVGEIGFLTAFPYVVVFVSPTIQAQFWDPLSSEAADFNISDLQLHR